MRARWRIVSATRRSAAATEEAFGGFQTQEEQRIRVVLFITPRGLAFSIELDWHSATASPKKKSAMLSPDRTG